jgi:hypothetical protein
MSQAVQKLFGNLEEGALAVLNELELYRACLFSCGGSRTSMLDLTIVYPKSRGVLKLLAQWIGASRICGGYHSYLAALCIFSSDCIAWRLRHRDRTHSSMRNFHLIAWNCSNNPSRLLFLSFVTLFRTDALPSTLPLILPLRLHNASAQSISFSTTTHTGMKPTTLLAYASLPLLTVSQAQIAAHDAVM